MDNNKYAFTQAKRKWVDFCQTEDILRTLLLCHGWKFICSVFCCVRWCDIVTVARHIIISCHAHPSAPHHTKHILCSYYVKLLMLIAVECLWLQEKNIGKIPIVWKNRKTAGENMIIFFAPLLLPSGTPPFFCPSFSFSSRILLLSHAHVNSFAGA